MARASRRLTAVNDPVDVFVAALDNMPEQFIDCRETQHLWKVTSNFRVVDSKVETAKRSRGGHSTYAEREMVCTRCGMERSDAYVITSFRGRTALRRINASYSAPDGYAITGVGGQVKGLRDLVHGAVFDRVVGEVAVRRPGRPRKDVS